MKKHTISLLLLLLLGLLAACNLPRRPTPGAVSPQDQVNTAAAQTVAAIGTELASGGNPTLVGPGTSIPSITAAPIMPTEPSSQTTAVFTPTATTAVTQPPTAAVTGTGTPGSETTCNRATFVRDVTIPDGSKILPGSTFTKTWELKNNGSCTWNSSYQLVFANRGSSMNGPASSPLTSGEVKPGETAQVSVTLRAPSEPGTVSGYWWMRASDGKSFGTGENAAAPFYVEIEVAEQFSFAEQFCSAEWSTAQGRLDCPGSESDANGYVRQIKNLKLEDNQEREGLGLVTAPQPVGGGVIVGKFPAVMVPAGADFRSTLSCAPGANGCYARFKVTYRVDNGEEQTLGEWNEGSEGGVTNAVADLDMVAGRQTAFTLYVYVSGTPGQSQGLWFDPRIVK